MQQAANQLQTSNLRVTPVFRANKDAFESYKYRVIANQGSTRSSKTYSICQLLPLIALQQKKSITVCSPSLPHLKRGAMRDMIGIIQQMGIYKEAMHNKTDNIYRFPTGSYIEFFGADETNKLRGPGRDILYLNEANLLNVEAFRQLSWRTKDVIFIDFNPADEFNWVYDVADDPKNILIHSTYKNNLANLTPEQVSDIESLKNADQNLWKVYGLGLRGTSSETIYTHWKEIDHMPDCDDFFYGLDFGYNNPSALVKVGVKDGKLYVEELFYETKLTTNDLAEVIKIYGITRSSEIFCDAAEPKTIEELSRMDINAKPADKSVWDGINMVKSMPLYITRNSINLIKEIRSYKWKTNKDGKVLDEPVKFMDHALDAMRYAIFTKLSKPQFQILI